MAFRIIPRVIASLSFLLAVLLIPTALFAQPDKQMKKADAYYKSYQYTEAASLYQRVLESNANNFDAALRAGECFRLVNDYREALRYYRMASEINPNSNDTVYFRIGEMYKVMGNYRKAKESFSEFLRRHKTTDSYTQRAQLEIKGCDLAEASLSERPPFRVKPATFNSAASDMFPAVLDQRQEDKYLVFGSHRPAGKKAKPYSGKGEPNFSDLYRVILENDSTFGNEIQPLGKPINTKYNDASQSFTGDGMTMYYAISNASKGGYGTSIYETRYSPVKKAWSKPVPVKGINGTIEVVINTRGKTKRVSSYDTHPYVTRDGRTMFFTSNRDGGQGGLDIWFSRRVGDGWSDPVNAGPVINTPFNETTPFLNDAGTKLFFGSNGHAGFGGYDIFASEGQVGNWREPVNMGAPLNTSYDDFGSIWRDKDSSVIFTSNRPGGSGRYDIWWGRQIYYKPAPVEVTLQGLIRDKQSKQPIPYATAILYEKTDKGIVALDTFKTDQSARYNFALKPSMTYKVLGNAPEYFANEIEVVTPAESAELERNIDIELEPIVINQAIVLNNIYYDFDEYYLRKDAIIELGNLVDILQRNPNITIQLGAHTDTHGGPQYNLELSKNRARAAVRYLVENRVHPNRISFIGFGESQPLIYPEMSEADEQMNRRVEFRVLSIDYGD